MSSNSFSSISFQMNESDPCIPWYLPKNDSTNIRLCNPWEARDFMKKMDETPFATLKQCLPDCTTTIYHGSVTAAPFKKCNMKNLEVSFMCNFETGLNPPIWGEMVSDQYIKETNSVPNYIEDQVNTNLRDYIGTSEAIVISKTNKNENFCFTRCR